MDEPPRRHGFLFWLVDVPALIISGWWTAYTVIIMLLTMVCVTVVAVMLVLRLFGIRWGW